MTAIIRRGFVLLLPYSWQDTNKVLVITWRGGIQSYCKLSSGTCAVCFSGASPTEFRGACSQVSVCWIAPLTHLWLILSLWSCKKQQSCYYLEYTRNCGMQGFLKKYTASSGMSRIDLSKWEHQGVLFIVPCTVVPPLHNRVYQILQSRDCRFRMWHGLWTAGGSDLWPCERGGKGGAG